MNWISAAEFKSRGYAPPLGYTAPLEDGEAGTAQTIGLMRQYIDQALHQQDFVRQAIDIVRAVPQYDEGGEAQAVFNWVVQNIRYTKHPVGKQILYPPAELLKIRASDCPNISMLVAALMIALGYPARLITVRADAASPEDFSHVYAEAEVPAGSGNWVPMDAARPGAQFGVAPPMYFGPRRAWSLTDDSFQDISDLHGGLAGPTTAGFGYCRPSVAMAGCRAGASSLMGTRPLPGRPLLGAYLGDDPNVAAEIAATSQGVANIIAAGRGSPYATFATPYTPGAAPFYPQAGYGLQTPYASTPISGTTILLLIGAALLLGGRH